MPDNEKQMQMLLQEAEKLQMKYELSKTVGPDYYEPGMMEYLDQYYGHYNQDTGELLLRFEAKGPRYEGRTRILEDVKHKQLLQVVRDKDNKYNSNNFSILTSENKDVGNMPAELCNAIAPLYDSGQLSILKAEVSYIEPVTKRSRYAKQAILFIELKCKINNEAIK